MNGQQERTIEAIANLATVTSSERATFAQMTNKIAQLTADLKTAQDKLVNALEMNVNLARQVNNSKYKANPTPRAPLCPIVNSNNKQKNIHYCWTHGFETDHTSFKCEHPAIGHQKRANAKNPMKGSMLNKEA